MRASSRVLSEVVRRQVAPALLSLAGEKPMSRHRSIAAFVILAAGAYLIVAAAGFGWSYCLTVDDLVQRGPRPGLRVRVEGAIDGPTLRSDPASGGARFVLRGESESIPVEYRGRVPDLLRPESRVIVEGEVDAAGTLHADVLLTRCASTYRGGDSR